MNSPSLSSPFLLTVAIPTYNRAPCLDRLLNVLLQELEHEDRVEVIVSDNASTDRTSDVVKTYQQKGLPIRYLCNQENRGADFNILQCYEEATGHYAWIFSDDDLIAPKTLTRVLNILTSQKHDLICIRSRTFEGDCYEQRPFAPKCDLEFETAEALARHVHIFFTFISGIIINKKRISSVEHPPFTSLLGTNLIQLGPLYTALNHHRTSLLIRDPLIAATGNSHVEYALYRVFGPTLSRITKEWIAEKTVRRPIICGAIRIFFPYFIFSMRTYRTSSISEDPHGVLSGCFANHASYWIFDYPICILPLPLARIWILGLRILNKIDALLGRPLW